MPGPDWRPRVAEIAVPVALMRQIRWHLAIGAGIPEQRLAVIDAVDALLERYEREHQ